MSNQFLLFIFLTMLIKVSSPPGPPPRFALDPLGFKTLGHFGPPFNKSWICHWVDGFLLTYRSLVLHHTIRYPPYNIRTSDLQVVYFTIFVRFPLLQ